MSENRTVACVTGASGMIGRRIAQKLLQRGYTVRALTRDKNFSIAGAQVVRGELGDQEILSSFLKGGHFIFHCAAELKDETRMWEVNVHGTERLLRIASESGARYFCHLSSVGVTGATDTPFVDERTPCNPQNVYERTKFAAETAVAKGIDDCRIVILRPTNVLDEKQPGALALPIRGRMRDKVTVFLKGGECAHIIHAQDVADAAMHFIDIDLEQPECYVVSCDHEPENTYADLWGLYRRISHGDTTGSQSPLHLPIAIPHILRSLKGCRSNRGNVRYSSDKILASGFRFSLGIEGAVRQVASYWKRTTAGSSKGIVHSEVDGA